MSSNEARQCPLPSRRSIHGVTSSVAPADPISAPTSLPSRVASRPVQRRSRATKIGILSGAGVGVLTLAAPLAGFASSWQAASDEEKVSASFGATTEWTGTDTEGVIAAAVDLTADQAAVSRAKLRTPVEVSHCVAGVQPANGNRTITQSQALYWPLNEGTYQVTSGFSWRVSPISGETLMHEGIDMAAPAGTPIYATADGVVVEVGSNSRSGNYVVIEHVASDGSIFTTSYLHQYAEDILVGEGQQIEAGEQIGAVGNAGWSTGAHLHYEVRDSSDNPIDPLVWLEESGAVFLGQDCA